MISYLSDNSIGRHLSDTFPIDNSQKQGNASSLAFNFASE